MAWGFGGFRHGSKKKKKTKSYDSWFERHSSEQLKTLLKAASLPVSGTKSKQIERLLQCPLTNIYAPEIRGMGHNYITLEQIKARCREAKLSPGGSKFDLVLRLIENYNDANIRSNTTPSKSNNKKRSTDSKDRADVTPGDCSESDAESVAAPTKKKRKVAPATKKQNKSLEGKALKKRKRFRFQKLNKQIFDRLQWKASYKHMNGDVIKGGRVEIDCPEPEVFITMFADDDECCEGKSKSMEIKLKGDTNGIKKARSSGKLSRSFKTDDDVECSGLKGKTYRLGSEAVLKSPTSVSLHHGKLACSFKYTVM